ncbi:unnamed protein product [Periconia digitata]|uniref:Tyrosine specific protein phosphatases domain-containing protein n=1 Tax=Periconia digitata TaxID=1303443 RepID=A0A9W4XNA9_9PLEO|nr:unnamed protein product [Periconia digitata]
MEPHYSPSHAVHNGTFSLPQAIVHLLSSVFARSARHPQDYAYPHHPLFHTINTAAHSLLRLLNPFATQGYSNPLLVGMVKTTALCGIGTVAFLARRYRQNNPNGGRQTPTDDSSPASNDRDPASTDPGLIRKHSITTVYTVPKTGFTYPGIRTFYRPHPQEDKLPHVPRPVPLLVFVHGLGGSVAQFHSILVSLSNAAPCLAIDFPGCGLSSLKPEEWAAYTTDALTHLLAVVIEAHRDRERGQQVVLVGHSMGCSIAALLASDTSPYADLLSANVAGLVAVCPQAQPPFPDKMHALMRITSLPPLIFDIFRRWDRRGGSNSKSVLRMTGKEADDETRRLQLRFNRQSRTPTWMRMARGMLPDMSSGLPKGGLPGKEVWGGLSIPLFLIAGESDKVTPTDNVELINTFLGRGHGPIEPSQSLPGLPVAAAPLDPAVAEPQLKEHEHQDSDMDDDNFPDAEPSATSTTDVDTQESVGASTAVADETSESSTPSSESSTTQIRPRRLLVKTAIMPPPASHSLVFAPTSARIISGLIGTFLSEHIDGRLSPTWQLQYLTTEGKWDVKNLAKWQAVRPVSEPIAHTFRALKTLREVDPSHSPKIFVKEWAGKLRAVVDISHDSPVYDPKGLEDGGIPYHKFPTVSKQPPTREEVGRFVELIDFIRSYDPPRRPQDNNTQGSSGDKGDDVLVGVHCHYGFNRTGFFLVSYMIERLGYTVQDAITEFLRARPPGIRHEHFVDELHVRYCSGLRKAPTL